MLPQNINALLVKHNGNFEEHPCEAAKFHSPRPLTTHAYKLPNNRVVFLCGTCRDNLSVYLYLWSAEGGLDWTTLREFGNLLRNIGSFIVDNRGESSD